MNRTPEDYLDLPYTIRITHDRSDDGCEGFVAEVEERVHVLVDPEIVKMEGEEADTEGCLSIPGLTGAVPRASRVVVKGKNRRGRGITVEAEGLLARVFQHEIDHLDGVLFLDRVVDRSTIREVATTAEVEPAAPAE